MGETFIGTVSCPKEAPYTPMLPEYTEPAATSGTTCSAVGNEYAAGLLTKISSRVLGLLGWCTQPETVWLLKLLRPPTSRGVLTTATDAEVLLDKLFMGKLVAVVRPVDGSVVVSGDCCAATLVTDAGWVTVLGTGRAGTAATPPERTLADPAKLEDPGRTLAAEIPELCTVDDMGCTSRATGIWAEPVASPLCKTWTSLQDVTGTLWLFVGSNTRGA